MNAEHDFELIIREAVVGADGDPDRVFSARRLAEIWCSLDRLSSLSEARMRFALYGLKELPHAACPTWLEEGLSRFHDETSTPNSVRRIVQVFLAKYPDAVGNVELTDYDCIAISWDDADDLRFIVSRPTLCWPAVSARAYRRSDRFAPALECHYARLAHQLIEMPYKKSASTV